MESFLELSLIMVIATGLVFVAQKLKQPLIIAYIITGLLVGPAFLGIIKDSHTIELLSKFGIALLLFIVGLGLNPSVVKEVGKVSFVTGVGQVIFTSLIGWFIIVAFGFGTVESIYLSIALAFSSTIIILKLLTDKKEQNQLYGKISIGFLLVQDVIATIALLVASSAGKSGLSLVDLGSLAVKGILAGVVIFLSAKYVLPRLAKVFAKSQEMLFVFGITWAFSIASLFYLIGFSFEVGALVSGIALASLPYAQEIASRMKSLKDFFIILFFVSLGSSLNLSSLGSVWHISVILSIFVLLGNPLIVILLMGAMGYTKNTSFKAGLAVAQISEFSLIFLLLGKQNGQVSDGALAMATMVGIITITASSYMIIYANNLFNFFEKYLSLFERRKVKLEQPYQANFDALIIGYRKGGREFIKALKDIKLKVLVIDYDPEVIDELERKSIPYLYGDATEVDLLDDIDVSEAKLVVSTITDFEPTLSLIDALETRLDNDTIVVANADSPKHAQKLYDRGVNYVMMPHAIGGRKVAEFLQSNGLSKKSFEAHKKRHIEFIQNDIAEEIEVKRHHAIGVVALNHKLAELAEEKLIHHHKSDKVSKPKDSSPKKKSSAKLKKSASKPKAKK
jgi:Kef-type K+ transport system membrane component KefB/voltage-gated potassium channel Kch